MDSTGKWYTCTKFTMSSQHYMEIISIHSLLSNWATWYGPQNWCLSLTHSKHDLLSLHLTGFENTSKAKCHLKLMSLLRCINLISVGRSSWVSQHRGVGLTCFSSSQRDYPKSLNQCLQERGLSVEMLFLQAESGLTQALQDVRGVGSPLCILVEQTNVALSSCTVIIFSEPLKSKSPPLRITSNDKSPSLF